MRQLDVAADRQAAALAAPRLAASMMPGPPPVMTAKPASASAPADRPRRARRPGRRLRDPRRAEDGDRRPDLGQRVEALDELGQDPQRPPRVGLEERRPLGRRPRGASRPRSGGLRAGGRRPPGASTPGRGGSCGATGTRRRLLVRHQRRMPLRHRPRCGRCREADERQRREAASMRVRGAGVDPRPPPADRPR